MHSGFLLKKGAIRKNWKRRWFVLEDCDLAYFRSDKKGEKSLGSVPIDAETIAYHLMDGDGSDHKYTFAVKSGSGERTYVFKADGLEDMQEWLRAINERVAEQSFVETREDEEGDEEYAALFGEKHGHSASFEENVTNPFGAETNPFSQERESTNPFEQGESEERKEDPYSEASLFVLPEKEKDAEKDSNPFAEETNPFEEREKVVVVEAEKEEEETTVVVTLVTKEEEEIIVEVEEKQKEEQATPRKSVLLDELSEGESSESSEEVIFLDESKRATVVLGSDFRKMMDEDFFVPAKRGVPRELFVTAETKAPKKELPKDVLELHVMGMYCRHCVDNVKEKLMDIEGVVDVDVEFDEEKVFVTFSKNVRPQVEQALLKEGMLV